MNTEGQEPYNNTAVILLELPTGSSTTEFVQKTALDIEYAYKRLDSFRSIANNQTAQIEAVKQYLIENYDDLELHADEIAALLDLELTREVEYTVSMTATVTVTVGVGQSDPDDLISDNLYIESNDSNVTVDSYDVDSVFEA
jgi:hypothetical protein